MKSGPSGPPARGPGDWLSGPVRAPCENPKTGAVLETAFVDLDDTKGTDLYLSVTSRDTVSPNPYRR